METMMKLRLAVFISCAALVAFSTWLKIQVVNNAGEAITIVSGEESFSLLPGTFKKFIYPTVAQKRTFSLSDTKCTYVYVMPSSIENYAQTSGFKGVVVVRLERDFRLYAASPASGTAAAIDMSLQQDGFPISPTEKQCQQTGN